MAYIKQELVLELLKRNSITEHITFSDGVSIYDTIANIPAADVVPKSEVAREIFAEIDKRFEALLKFYPLGGEVTDAKNFIDFHWKYIRHSIMCDYDAKLKKKYTNN